MQDIERLKSDTEVELSIEGGTNPTIDTQIREIDAQSVNFFPENFLQNGISSLAATAMCHLGINPGILAIEAHLDKLTFIPPGGCMKPACVLKREPGIQSLYYFGTDIHKTFKLFVFFFIMFWLFRHVCKYDFANPN